MVVYQIIYSTVPVHSIATIYNIAKGIGYFKVLI